MTALDRILPTPRDALAREHGTPQSKENVQPLVGDDRHVHAVMQTAQLRHLAARVEGRLPRDGWREVAQGVGGAAIMTAAFLTPFMRGTRNRWGLSDTDASRSYPGDELVSRPRWSWTHGIEIEAAPENVWPWVAQMGADRGGFYSYQWLENVVGCNLRNAETVHDEWTLKEGDAFRLHPEMPALRVVSLLPGRSFVAYAPADAAARSAGRPWAETSWLFYIEPLEKGRSRFVSRFRCNYSDDLSSQLSLTPTLLEPIGFAMDRRMLKGVKERAEQNPLHLKKMLASR